MIMKNSQDRRAVEFKLDHLITIGDKHGDYEPCDTVVMYAPTAQNRREAAIVKTFVGALFEKMNGAVSEEAMEKAITHLAEVEAAKAEAKAKANADITAPPVDDSNDDESRISGKAFARNATLHEIDPDKQERAFTAFKQLLTMGKCGAMFDADIVSDVFEKFDFHDMENMFYEYALSFLLDSLFS